MRRRNSSPNQPRGEVLERCGIAGTGIVVDTICAGLGEFERGQSIGSGRMRARGGGRRPLNEVDPKLLIDLELLVDEGRRGDPGVVVMELVGWRHLASEAREPGH
jgi:hypothetical protein